MYLHAVVILVNFWLLMAASLEARFHQPSWLRSPLQADAPAVQPAAGEDVGVDIVASCRASCGTRFLQMPVTDEQCIDNRQCVKCWRLCDLLYESELKWRKTCERDDCFDGCKAACDFDFSQRPVSPSAGKWIFPADPILNAVDDNTLHVTWSPVEYQQNQSSSPPPGGVPIVYTLLFRDSTNPHWRHVTSTMNLKANVERPYASQPSLRFLLLASSSEGTLSRITIPATRRRSTPSTVPSVATSTHSQERRRPVMTSPEVEAKATDDGSLEAVVTWGQRFTETGVPYTVTWGRLSCNVGPRSPYCPLQADEFTATIKAKDREEMGVVLTQLTYNSEYRLRVTLRGGVHTSVFFTPACRQVDATFMRCIQPATTVPPSVKTMKHTAPSVGSSAMSPLTTGAPRPSTRGQRNATDPRSPLQPEGNSVTMGWLSANWLVLVVATVASLTTMVIFMLCLHAFQCLRQSRTGDYHPNPDKLTYASVPTPYSSHALLHDVASLQRLLTYCPLPAAEGQLHESLASSSQTGSSVCSHTLSHHDTVTSGFHDVTYDVENHFRHPKVPDVSVIICSDDEQRPTSTKTFSTDTWTVVDSAPCRPHQCTNTTVPHRTPPVHSSPSSGDFMEQRRLVGSARRKLHFSSSCELSGATCRELRDAQSPSAGATYRELPAIHSPSPVSFNQFCFIEDYSSDVEC